MSSSSFLVLAAWRARSFVLAQRTASWLLPMLLLASPGCSSVQGQVISPESATIPTWTAEERAENISMRTVRTTETASYHVVRLKGSEQPHYHDKASLVAFILQGRVIAHLGNRQYEATVGDTIEIPKGTLHWIENVDSEPSVAYVVFSPGFDKADRRDAPRQ